jgi:hypothetical protein
VRALALRLEATAASGQRVGPASRMQEPPGMNTQRLDESSRLVAATSWGAIAAGVFVALALQTALLLLGLAFGLSVGDERIGGGYALWAIIVQLASFALGAALAARIAHAGNQLGGIVAGVMTWAVAVVVNGALGGIALGAPASMRLESTSAWAAFFGIVLALGAAIFGGVMGATRGRTRTTAPMPAAPAQPLGPTYHEPV